MVLVLVLGYFIVLDLCTVPVDFVLDKFPVQSVAERSDVEGSTCSM